MRGEVQGAFDGEAPIKPYDADERGSYNSTVDGSSRNASARYSETFLTITNFSDDR